MGRLQWHRLESVDFCDIAQAESFCQDHVEPHRLKSVPLKPCLHLTAMGAMVEPVAPSIFSGVMMYAVSYACSAAS